MKKYILITNIVEIFLEYKDGINNSNFLKEDYLKIKNSRNFRESCN